MRAAPYTTGCARIGSLAVALLCGAAGLAFLVGGALGSSGCVPPSMLRQVTDLDVNAGAQDVSFCYDLSTGPQTVAIVTHAPKAECPSAQDVASVFRLVQHREVIGNHVAVIFTPYAIDCAGYIADGCANTETGLVFVRYGHGWPKNLRHEFTHMVLALEGDGHDDGNTHTAGIWRVVDFDAHHDEHDTDF